MTKTKKRTLGDTLRAGRELPPAIPTKELVGKIFSIESIRHINTEYGDRVIGTIRLNGNEGTVDCWLNGAVLSRQLAEMVEDDCLPATVKLLTDPDLRDAYYLTEPEVGDTFDAEIAAQEA